MANSVTIRTTAPGAKEAAGQLGMLKAQVVGMGSAKAGPLGGLVSGMGGAGVAMLGAVGAGVAIGKTLEGVGEFLGQAAAAAIADEKSIRSLNQALKDNVPTWDGNTSAIDKSTDASIKLGFADDTSRESIQKLVIATGDVNKALYLNKLAMDVARGRNIDLASATDIVIKANMGNVGALRRMGIEVDKNATSTQILGTLNEKYAGQAAVYAQTTEGQMSSAAQSVSELQEGFGYGLLPVMKDTLSYTNTTLIPGVQNLGDTFGDLFHDIQTAVGGGQPLVEATDLYPTDNEVTGAGAAMLNTYMDTLTSRASQVHSAVNKGVTQPTLAELAKTREAAGVAAYRAGVQITDDLAGALSGNKDVVSGAMDKVKFAITHPMEETRQLARIEGAMTSTQMAEGLASRNPYVRTVAQQQMKILIDEWESITGRAYGAGADAGRAYVSAYEKQLRNIAGGSMGGTGNDERGNRTNNNNRTVNVHVNLSTRDVRNKVKHDTHIQGGLGGF